MVELTGELLDPEDAQRFGLVCGGLDAVDIEAAYDQQPPQLPECRFAVRALIAVRFGVDADMVAALPFCAIHFNAFHMSLSEGVSIDLNLLK